jgi:hypothetical protein
MTSLNSFMTTSLGDIKSVHLDEIKQLRVRPTGHLFFVRDIVIKTNGGLEYTIVLKSDVRNNLNIEGEVLQ